VWFVVDGSRYCSWATRSKARAFWVLVILLWSVLCHAHQLFGVMCERQWVTLFVWFWLPKSHTWLCLHRVSSSAVIPGCLSLFQGPIVFYSYAVLAELEEMCVGSILGYRPSSIEDFSLAPIHPPLVSFSGPSLGPEKGAKVYVSSFVLEQRFIRICTRGWASVLESPWPLACIPNRCLRMFECTRICRD
jgi:hypothetical protein